MIENNISSSNNTAEFKYFHAAEVPYSILYSSSLFQVLKTHVRGQYIVRDSNQNTVESATLLKQVTCLVKLALPNVSVFKCDSYIEVCSRLVNTIVNSLIIIEVSLKL